ncbi:MAG: hypothetical protein ACXWWQ_01295 [Candidatus Limnocylindria bacterium]
MKRIAPTFLILLSLLAACAAGVPGASPDPDESGDGGDAEHPTAGDEAIFIIDSAGGFVPVQFIATHTPTFVLLGDGRVIVQGAQTLEFPGPALPPLIERTLTEKGIQEVLKAIGDTNLFTSDLQLRGAANMVADASDTIFTLNGGGQEVTVSVYGLGTLTLGPGQEAPAGISQAELQAHAVLQQLYESMLALESWLPADAWEDEGWKPYEPEAFRLYVRDVTGQPVEGGDMPEQVREWPTDTDPAAFGEEQAHFGDGTRCGVVEGEEAAIWFAELSAATQLTLWAPASDPDARFSVAVRPLLPHEEAACPELVGA